jgi:hypothetical protein
MRYIKITKLGPCDEFTDIKQWVYAQIWIQKDDEYDGALFYTTTHKAWEQFIRVHQHYQESCPERGIYFLPSIKYKVIEL